MVHCLKLMRSLYSMSSIIYNMSNTKYMENHEYSTNSETKSITVTQDVDTAKRQSLYVFAVQCNSFPRPLISLNLSLGVSM